MNLEQLNYNMYMTANHLNEAAKYLLALDEGRALQLMQEADYILSLMTFEPEKVSDERLTEVLNEILDIDLEKK